MPVVRLSTIDPYLNLAQEEQLLDRIDEIGPTLVLWRNAPCVVIGRHQNPWVECDLRRMKADGVVLVRRTSGGGAVYHDGGNTNFSFVALAGDYDQERHFRVVIAALASLGIDAWKTDRNDLRVGERKISGNAFRHTRGRSLHHGTLLVHADLDLLTAYLAPAHPLIETKATASVRSRVTNLAAARPGLRHEELWDALEAAFVAEYGAGSPPPIAEPAAADPAALARRAAELASWDWVYGHTPAFVRRLSLSGREMALTVRKGRIVAVEAVSAAAADPAAAADANGRDGRTAPLRNTLVGMRYDRDALRAVAGPGEIGDLVRAIAEEID